MFKINFEQDINKLKNLIREKNIGSQDFNFIIEKDEEVKELVFSLIRNLTLKEKDDEAVIAIMKGYVPGIKYSKLV